VYNLVRKLLDTKSNILNIECQLTFVPPCIFWALYSCSVFIVTIMLWNSVSNQRGCVGNQYRERLQLYCCPHPLTLCCQATYNDVIGKPCVVCGSHISTFSYTTYTYVCGLFCLAYCFKVIRNLKQDMWDSSYKHTDPSWPHILRIIRLQQSDHRSRYPLYFLS
jgi:hypothetical protein